MTVTGPSFIALQVKDLAQAAAFYEQQVGLARTDMNRPGAVVFATSPIPFAAREPLPGKEYALGTASPSGYGAMQHRNFTIHSSHMEQRF